MEKIRLLHRGGKNEIHIGTAVIIHEIALVVNPDACREQPSPQPEIRLVVQGRIVCEDAEIAPDRELLLYDVESSESLRNIRIGIVQDKGIDAVPEEADRGAHIVVLGEAEKAGLTVPPLRLGNRLENKFLSYSVLPLGLIQCEH